MFLLGIIRTIVWLSFFAFLGGFFYFVNLIPGTQTDKENIITDATVILTGGKMRIEEGLKLLESGKTRRVFITGVGSDRLIIQINDKLSIFNRHKVELGRLATSTRGNALETKDWIRNNRVKTISLVTANYHMPRSLLEFHYYLGNDVEIIPHPAFPNSFRRDKYWLHLNSIKILVLEYCKTLLFLYDKNLVK